MNVQPRRGLPAQRHFTAVHSEDAGVARGRAPRRGDHVTRQKAELHQPAGEILRQIDAIQHSLLALFQLHQRHRFLPSPGVRLGGGAVDSELHLISQYGMLESFCQSL